MSSDERGIFSRYPNSDYEKYAPEELARGRSVRRSAIFGFFCWFLCLVIVNYGSNPSFYSTLTVFAFLILNAILGYVLFLRAEKEADDKVRRAHSEAERAEREKQYMKSTFNLENIKNANIQIINQSRDIVANINQTQPTIGDSAREITDYVENSGNQEAIELWNSFLQEVEGRQSKPLLRAYWDRIEKILPSIATLTASAEKLINASS